MIFLISRIFEQSPLSSHYHPFHALSFANVVKCCLSLSVDFLGVRWLFGRFFFFFVFDYDVGRIWLSFVSHWCHQYAANIDGLKANTWISPLAEMCLCCMQQIFLCIEVLHAVNTVRVADDEQIKIGARSCSEE